jgi:serine/threonine protein kinase
MAPEYIQEGRLGPGVDVYQVGLSLAEALSGRPVVDHPSAQACFMSHLMGQLDLGTEVLDSALRPVVERALAHDPAQRHADAGELRAHLEEVFGTAPVLRRTAPAPVPRVARPRATPEPPTRIMDRRWSEDTSEQHTVRMAADDLFGDALLQEVTEQLARQTPVSQPSLAAPQRPAPRRARRASRLAGVSLGLVGLVVLVLWMLLGR